MGTGRRGWGGGLLGCAPRGPVSTAGLQPLRPWLGDSLSDQRGASRLVTEVWDRKDLQPCEEILRTLEAAERKSGCLKNQGEQATCPRPTLPFL